MTDFNPSPECNQGCVALSRHIGGCPHAPSLGRGWCPDCQAMREVVDRFTASTMQPYGEMEYGVTVFECDHDVQGPERRVAAAPGAPYAGVPTSPTSRGRDLLATPAFTDDPWADR